MKTKIAKLKSIGQKITSLLEEFPKDRHQDILFDQWSLKDIVAHLSNWMVHDISCLKALTEGKEPYWEQDVDDFNAKGVALRKDKTWDEVFNEFLTLRDTLIRLYENIPQDLWDKPIWKDKGETANRFLDEDIAHWEGEHLGDFKEKMQIATSSWITPKAHVRNSAIGTKGLFATANIKAGDKVVVWKANYTNKKGADDAQKLGKLIMQWDDDVYSVEDRGDDIGYYINHACDSNLWMEGKETLVARRNVEAGEELTADYALWEADENYVSKWTCNCGAQNCRKKVTGKDWMMTEVQKQYLNHFSPLINIKIKKGYKQ
jgi:hypothetical protein